MHRLLFVEDSTDLQNLVKKEFMGWFQVSSTGSLAEAMKVIRAEVFDLFLLDVHLPDGSGFEFCAMLKSHRQLKEIPIIFLTGKSDPIDKMMGFSIGADDYMVKPFEPIELRARIEARLRKKNFFKRQEEGQYFGDLRFDRVRQRVFATDCEPERDLNLTPFEFKLLYFLASSDGQIFNRIELLKNLLESNVHVSEDNIYTHISALRRKLANKGNYLECIPRIGYRFHCPVK